MAKVRKRKPTVKAKKRLMALHSVSAAASLIGLALEFGCLDQLTPEMLEKVARGEKPRQIRQPG